VFVKPKHIKKIVSKDKIKQFRNEILTCQIILFDLNDGEYDDLNFILLTLKNARLSEKSNEIIVVVISSIFTWALTPAKIREPNDDEVTKEMDEKERIENNRKELLKKIDDLIQEKRELLELEGATPEKIDKEIYKIRKQNPLPKEIVLTKV